MPKKAPGGRRDAVLNVRVPARLKFGLDLISRRFNESTSDTVIRALNDSLTSENGGLLVDVEGVEHQVDLLRAVWDENEVLRTVKLALLQPSLLTWAEKSVWESVRADDKYWARGAGAKKAKAATQPQRRLEDLQLDVLEAEWPQLMQVASD